MTRLPTIGVLALISLLGCVSPRQPDTRLLVEGNGSTEPPILKVEAADSLKSVLSEEIHWLKKHYPDAKISGISWRFEGGSPIYDLFTLASPSGDEREVRFDVSKFSNAVKANPTILGQAEAADCIRFLMLEHILQGDPNEAALQQLPKAKVINDGTLDFEIIVRETKQFYFFEFTYWLHRISGFGVTPLAIETKD